ncbi:LysM peptidoglycan-binding domain-containing protein [Lysobacter sp. TY2-98]|nr:LysM peptidoglycan-binding domain-containing protein [Lysobacter sp. TY2-98]
MFHRDEAATASSTSTHTPREIVPRVVDVPAAPQSAAPTSTNPVTTPATPPNAVAPTPTARQRTYTVQQGDSLSKIALRLYGDVNRWTLLMEANRDRMSDPDRIYPGQVLMVPDAPPLH